MSLPKTNTAFISYEFSFHKEKVNPEFISKEWFTEKICKKHKIYWHMYFRWLIYFSYLLTSNKYRRMKYEFNFHWKNLFILIIKQDENFENLVIGGKDGGIMAVKAVVKVVRRMLMVMLNDWCQQTERLKMTVGPDRQTLMIVELLLTLKRVKILRVENCDQFLLVTTKVDNLTLKC